MAGNSPRFRHLDDLEWQEVRKQQHGDHTASVWEKWPEFSDRYLTVYARYDPGMIVGVLGGSSGTSFDAFTLLAEAKKHGARVALFGRKIKDAEHPLSFVAMLRRVADGQINPKDAVRAYHGELEKLKIPPRRTLDDDLELTATELSYTR